MTPSPARVALRHLARRQGKPQFARYKGRPYRVLFLGPTRYGERAHLQFLDGSKDFWVDADRVREEDADFITYECPECGDIVRPGTTCWETGYRH